MSKPRDRNWLEREAERTPDPRPSPAPGQEEKAAWDALHLAIHWGISQFANERQVWKVWNELRRAGYAVVPSCPLPAAGLSEGHEVQRDVEDFHRALDIPVCDTPAIRRPELRGELIMEEAIETYEAITGKAITHQVEEDGGEPDLALAIDGLCDLLCVVYGAAAEFGINLAPFWDEVHRTNMAKVGGPVREDGKRLKPEGWEPPDIAGVLARLASAPNREEG